MMSTVTTAQIRPQQGSEPSPTSTHETLKDTHLPSTPRTIIIAVDGSKSSHRALAWTLDHVVRPSDRIILSTIAVAPSATWSDMMQFWEKGHSYGLEKAAEMEERVSRSFFFEGCVVVLMGWFLGQAREFATQTLMEASGIIQSRNLPTSEAFLITHEVISVPSTSLTAPLPPTPVPDTPPRRHPAQLIADLCATHSADMLVIGGHEEEKGVTGFLTWFKGGRKMSLQEAVMGIAPCPVIVVREGGVEGYGKKRLRR
ncbi:hypothetical protein BC829DRAFT_284101 [Chytridium lagenaria]|nr:hypothetical protein BC829DRAFT_284101 [Chytridium lagenaria]